MTLAEKFDAAIVEWELIQLGIDQRRPTNFSQCKRGPCPWVACKFHLYLDFNERTGAIKLNFPHLEPDQLEETCALRVGRKVKETGEETPRETVARLLNITSERERQIEATAIAKLRLIAADDLLRMLR